MKPPKIVKIYQLVRQSGMMFNAVGSSGAHSLGIGFYNTMTEAEHNRTMEVLKDTSTPKSKYHVFELDVPNPAYQEEETK